ncbi:hypothetical protein [Bradyrhizobium cenepequi]|uniref:hypothetical protein n=1 Tax=Bradyrhizobium cenepequi TaxID=2821403 RepID=UPI001CE33F26|nr:hypothetical protein [Bradyrhizobium cenepequi]MCA6110471.1 hypothetical protein [Bradyrhizobium cenepequi]
MRERLSILDKEAQDLAMPAVSGDQDAAALLARINAQVQQITADLAVLERARLTAAQQQREASEAKAAADRAFRMAEARASVARLIEIARQIDQAQAAMLPALSELASIERAICASLRLAGASPAGGIVGQRDLAGLAMDRLTLAAQGRTMFLSDQRCVEEVAIDAWRDLLANEDEL